MTITTARPQKIVVRKTPYGLHLYTARVVRGSGVYGFGNTPSEARAKLAELAARFAEEEQAS